MLQVGIWLVAFKWIFIMWYLEKYECRRILVYFCLFCSVPISILLFSARLGKTPESSGRREWWIRTSIVLWSMMKITTATGLHVSLGGWFKSAYLPIWSLVALPILPLFNVSSLLSRSIGAVVFLTYFADMFGEVMPPDALPAPANLIVRTVHDGLRAIFPLEPVESLPPVFFAWMMANNFFTPTLMVGIILTGLMRARDKWQAKSDQLLHSLVPEEIANKLRTGAPRKSLSRHEIGVTCFFSDIVEYTELCDRMNKSEDVVAMLDKMYTAFDHMVELTGSDKVETIGDSYFAVASLNNDSISTEESCYRLAIFALSVQEFIQGPFGQAYGIQVRCGLHTGDLVSGVLGNARPRHVLVGDTVNTASRMESIARPNTVNVSGTTACHLFKYFELIDRGATEIKGKGNLHTYEIGARKPGATPTLSKEIPDDPAWIATQAYNLIKDRMVNVPAVLQERAGVLTRVSS